MRNYPDSNPDDARIELPVLVKLPDLTAQLKPDEPAGEDEVSTSAADEDAKPGDKGHRHRRRSDGKGSKRRPTRTTARVLNFKSHFLATIIVLAFVLLIGTLVLHQQPTNDAPAGPTWEASVADSTNDDDRPTPGDTPDSSIPEVNPVAPRRLPSIDEPDTDLAQDSTPTSNAPRANATAGPSSPILLPAGKLPSVGTAVYPDNTAENRGAVRVSVENTEPTERVR